MLFRASVHARAGWNQPVHRKLASLARPASQRYRGFQGSPVRVEFHQKHQVESGASFLERRDSHHLGRPNLHHFSVKGRTEKSRTRTEASATSPEPPAPAQTDDGQGAPADEGATPPAQPEERPAAPEGMEHIIVPLPN